MKTFFYLTIAALLALGANAGVIDWGKYDSRLLGNSTDQQQAYPMEVVANHTIEGSGMSPDVQQDQPKTKVELCETGWYRFDNSCYFVETKNQATVKEAEKECKAKKANMLTVDSVEEYDAVMKLAPAFGYTWTGLFKKTEGEKALWQTETQFDYKKMNWLIKSDDDAMNGWNTISRCAAYYNGNFDAGRHVYYYPCDYKFNYICEKNFGVEHIPVYFF